MSVTNLSAFVQSLIDTAILTGYSQYTVLYEEHYLLVCDVMYSGRNLPSFRGCVMKVGSTFPAVNGMGLMVTTSKKNIQCIQEQVYHLLPLFAFCLCMRYLYLLFAIKSLVCFCGHIDFTLPSASEHFSTCYKFKTQDL
jgi:hypothetical protein